MPYTNFPNGATSFGAPLPGGPFWPTFGQTVLYVNGNLGSDGQPGTSPDLAFKTMGRAFQFVQSGQTVIVEGQLTEQITAPLNVSDVTILGAGTRPRYGNESSFTNPLLDYAACWRPAATPLAATPNLTLRQQGWRFANILFDCPVDSSGVMMRRQEDATYPDASSASFYGCQFSDGAIGIEDVGGAYNVLTDGCLFRRLTGIAYKVTSTGIAVPLQNTIQNCVFQDNVNAIVGSFVEALIQNNILMNTTTQRINTIAIAAQGARNFVINNYVSSIAANINPAGGFTGSATDVWRTFANGTADPVVVSPPV